MGRKEERQGGLMAGWVDALVKQEQAIFGGTVA